MTNWAERIDEARAAVLLYLENAVHNEKPRESLIKALSVLHLNSAPLSGSSDQSRGDYENVLVIVEKALAKESETAMRDMAEHALRQPFFVRAQEESGVAFDVARAFHVIREAYESGYCPSVDQREDIERILEVADRAKDRFAIRESSLGMFQDTISGTVWRIVCFKEGDSTQLNGRVLPTTKQLARRLVNNLNENLH